jgi:CubicO group peptidase (beta-lactamase class C family)
MSCTKSIVSLAVGQAIAEGKIKSIDQPVYDFFPEMKQGRKAAMTVRHLLLMTSGIQNTGSADEIYPAPDIVKLALAAELTTAPGAAFDYNNKSVNLLSGIIHIATQQPLDDYVRDRFFNPMGIESWNWSRDDDGNASAMADLALYPADFAKFGALVLQKGRWEGKQLVPEAWVDQIGKPSQPYNPLYGLLWWRAPAGSVGELTADRIEDLKKAGLGGDVAAALRPLAGRSFQSQSEWHAALAVVLPDWEKVAPRYPGVIDFYASDAPRWRYSNFDGIEAEGSFGQYLTIFPKRDLVAVRMIKPFDGFVYNQHRFEDFTDVVRSLAAET